MNVQYFCRSVYGNLTKYPANDAARVLCEIAGRKTLDTGILQLAEKLGHTITRVEDPRHGPAFALGGKS